jgi:hypothetical protein
MCLLPVSQHCVHDHMCEQRNVSNEEHKTICLANGVQVFASTVRIYGGSDSLLSQSHDLFHTALTFMFFLVQGGTHSCEII